MKRIEDEDVRPAFDKAWHDFCEADYLVRDYVNLAEHFFQEGRDSLAKEFWTTRPKRTIKEIIKRDGEILGFSSDGKVYRFIWYSQEWYPLPDLPQED